MDAGIGGRDFHGAAGIGRHRTGVHLITVPARGRPAVIAHRERPEMKL